MRKSWEQSLRESSPNATVLDTVRQALDAHAGCVRVSLIEGDALVEIGDLERALQAYRRVEVQDADYLSEAIDRMYRCYRNVGRDAGKTRTITEFFSALLRRYAGISVTLALSEIKRQEGGEREALVSHREIARTTVTARLPKVTGDGAPSGGPRQCLGPFPHPKGTDLQPLERPARLSVPPMRFPRRASPLAMPRLQGLEHGQADSGGGGGVVPGCHTKRDVHRRVRRRNR